MGEELDKIAAAVVIVIGQVATVLLFSLTCWRARLPNIPSCARFVLGCSKRAATNSKLQKLQVICLLRGSLFFIVLSQISLVHDLRMLLTWGHPMYQKISLWTVLACNVTLLVFLHFPGIVQPRRLTALCTGLWLGSAIITLTADVTYGSHRELGGLMKLMIGSCFPMGWTPLFLELVQLLFLLAFGQASGTVLSDENQVWVFLPASVFVLVTILLIRATLTAFAELTVQAVTSESELGACKSLLAKFCDSVIELDESLCIAEHSQNLSNMLLQQGPMQSSLAGTKFSQLAASDAEQDYIDAKLEIEVQRADARDSDWKASLAESFNSRLRDALNNTIEVEVLHVKFSGADERPRKLIGIREREDHNPVAPLPADKSGGASLFREEPSGQNESTSEKQRSKVPIMAIDTFSETISHASKALEARVGKALVGAPALDLLREFDDGRAVMQCIQSTSYLFDLPSEEKEDIVQFSNELCKLTVFERTYLESFAVVDLQKLDNVPGLWELIRKNMRKNTHCKDSTRTTKKRLKMQRSDRREKNDEGSVSSDGSMKSLGSRASRSSGSRSEGVESGQFVNMHRRLSI